MNVENPDVVGSRVTGRSFNSMAEPSLAYVRSALLAFFLKK